MRLGPAVALVLVMATACPSGDSSNASSDSLGERRSRQQACDDAWAAVPSAADVTDPARRYERTLTDCTGLALWNTSNRASGSALDLDLATIDGFCRSLAVASVLCAEAAQALGGEPPGLDEITCAGYVRDVRDPGDRLRITNAILRRMNPRNPAPGLTVQLDYGSDVLNGCDPAGTGSGSQGIHVADIAERVYIANPAAYGG